MYKKGQYLNIIYRNLCRYLDDFYELELQAVSGVKGWSIPDTKGGGPSARESHTSVAYCGPGHSPKLYIYGGMCGHRLGDLWQLDIGEFKFSLNSSLPHELCEIKTQKVPHPCISFCPCPYIESMTWSTPEMRGPCPLARSLHSATIIGNKSG